MAQQVSPKLFHKPQDKNFPRVIIYSSHVTTPAYHIKQNISFLFVSTAVIRGDFQDICLSLRYQNVFLLSYCVAHVILQSISTYL